MLIRLANNKDFELFLSIKLNFNNEYGIQNKSKEFILSEFREYLKNGSIIISIVKDKIIGYLCGVIDKDLYQKSGYIGEIFVSKKFRGKGVSTKLKDEFIKFLRSKNVSLCRVDVNPNNPAQNAYKNWGFKIDKYRMTLKLKD